MSSNSTETSDHELKGATEVGNFFVSNYPPYSFWSPDKVNEIQDAMARPPEPENPLGLYVHIPFCRKRCHFCYFRVYTGAKSAEIKDYVAAALKELDMYVAQPFVGNRKPTFIYFGGGTPSFLSTAMLSELVEEMDKRLSWSDAKEIAFECEPGTLTEKKIKVIKELGITRLSLGVENLDDHVLEINGRAHRTPEIERAYKTAQDAGFEQINIDLIAGMLEETEDNWKRTVEKAIAMDAESITIYQMEVPYNTTIYQRMKESGVLKAPVANWETKRRWVTYAYEQLEQSGYEVKSAYTAVKKGKNAEFLYRDLLWKGADLLSLGVASFGHINGTHYQNNHDIDPYLEMIGKDQFPIYRALTPSDEERMIREFVLHFKLGWIDPAYYQQKFGVDVRERFAMQLGNMKKWGFIDRDDELISVTRQGLLQIDVLLHEFFLPQHVNQRYA
ncbi:MAG: oxygen-independent coproporphyrinogen-3 oxidase [Kiritimatiellia bacterium]|jgi:oxygen-independent coproporphyrinogen III oxidase